MSTATMQGQLWSARARDWADLLEGERGWGLPLYRQVLEQTGVGPGAAVLDVGCGAGRFCRLAADRGASVAGIDAAEGLLAIARERTPDGDFLVGDMVSLPWDDDSFDLVTGFSTFQFADDPARALAEAARVARPGRPVVVAVPGRPQDSELTPFLMALMALLPEPPPPDRGVFALSQPGRLEQVLTAAGLTTSDAGTLDCPMEFADEDELVRGMLAPGPAVMATEVAGEDAVREAALSSLAPFRNAAGGYRIENPFRYLVAAA
ncbi:MAG: class I SAM-dependent methyltransferase [Nitriliruptorales bacterium]